MKIIKLILSLVAIVTFQQITCINAEDLQFGTRLQQLCSQIKLYCFSHVLKQTQDGNEIILYGVSNKSQLVSFESSRQAQSILLTGVMHPREDTSFKFIQHSLNRMITEFGLQDSQIQYIFTSTLVLIVPFLNIDAIKWMIQNQGNEFARKNRNQENSQKCKKDISKGVDINRNFDYKFGTLRTSADPCSEEYRGKKPFSEVQSQAVRDVFQHFSVRANVDIHSFGNIWIYPYASETQVEKIKSDKLYPVYEQIFSQFRNLNVSYANCYESLKYTADGVYIDWALNQGSLSFALQFGNDFNQIGNQLDKHYEALIKFMFNSTANFKVYSKVEQTNEEDVQICVKSLSVIDIDIQLLKVDQNEVQQILKVKSLQNECFKTRIDINAFPKLYLGLKTGIVVPIDISLLQIKQIKADESLLWSLYNQFKVQIFILVILYCIGSLCGLSVFCENALGIEKQEEESKTLRNNTSFQSVDSPEIQMQTIESIDNYIGENKQNEDSQVSNNESQILKENI